MRRPAITLSAALALLLTAGAGSALASDPTQAVEQSAGTSQSANSNATSEQINPSNSNISVRIGSSGNNGPVSQSNGSTAKSGALNGAFTGQSAQQAGGGGTQAASQDAGTSQTAGSSASSEQIHPSNSNIDVRIGSDGDNGAVEQSNSSTAKSGAGNLSGTLQGVEQSGGGGGCCAGSGTQAAEQSAGTEQDANSDASSKQVHPSNSNISVRIGSDGDNGSVSQSNDSAALSLAGNKAKTEQGVGQSQGRACCGGDKVQAVGQWATTEQGADANADSFQKGAKNSNTPVRIHSEGDDGEVSQSNSSTALSAAGNRAATKQFADQSQHGGHGCGCAPSKPEKKYFSKDCCSGAGVQAVGQWAYTGQSANSNAESKQIGAKNENAPVRIKSEGGGGSVEQSNSSLAKALSFNAAFTLQDVTQTQ